MPREAAQETARSCRLGRAAPTGATVRDTSRPQPGERCLRTKAATVASDVVSSGAITPTVVFAGLIGAISWNIITWYFGLPSSSSHALIGGVVGSAFVASGSNAVLGDGVLGKVLISREDPKCVAGQSRRGREAA